MKTLVLVPTQLEADLLLQRLRDNSIAFDIPIQVCGFGAVTSGICAARSIAEYLPERIILTGIAGALCGQTEIGSAYQFSQVALFGVGAGHGDELLTPDELGWTQLPTPEGQPLIGDIVQLNHSSSITQNLLVTSCAASASPTEASWRRTKFPNARAEDMEGFSVAVACQLANTPLDIIRGISNIAGDRNKQNWQIAPAIAAAAELVIERLR